MQTVIKWRGFPEQKPGSPGMYTVMVDGLIEFRRFNISRLGKETYWFTRHSIGEIVTHFCLPEDITTTDTKEEGTP